MSTMNRGNVSRLTEMQKVCLRHVATHLSSKDIARKLGISPHTVDTHLRAAIKLLEAKNRHDAAMIFLAVEDDPSLALSSQPSRLAEAPQSALFDSPPAMRETVSDHRRLRSKLLPLPSFWGDENDLSNFAKVGWIVLLSIYICLSIGALVALFNTVNSLY
jgi:DNA-binding CsgD family transcriptional regulator